ncbi:MAG: hypothetical protein V2A54_14850 [Bacteroidota bacterium]
MDTLILFLIAAGIALLLFVIYKWFLTKRYPEKTNQMLDSIPELEQLGLKRKPDGYAGICRGYYVNVYATTSLKRVGYMSGDNFQVWVSVLPDEQLTSMSGFFGKYMTVKGDGYTMIGFVLRYTPGLDNEEAIQNKLISLIESLKEKGVKPYPVSGI